MLVLCWNGVKQNTKLTEEIELALNSEEVASSQISASVRQAKSPFVQIKVLQAYFGFHKNIYITIIKLSFFSSRIDKLIMNKRYGIQAITYIQHLLKENNRKNHFTIISLQQVSYLKEPSRCSQQHQCDEVPVYPLSAIVFNRRFAICRLHRNAIIPCTSTFICAH